MKSIAFNSFEDETYERGIRETGIDFTLSIPLRMKHFLVLPIEVWNKPFNSFEDETGG